MTGGERLSRDGRSQTWNFRVSLRIQCFRPGGSNQQLSVWRMSVYIDRFYSAGSLYIYCCFLPRKSLYCWLYNCQIFLLWFDVFISGISQIGAVALLVSAPQPLYKRRSGVVSVPYCSDSITTWKEHLLHCSTIDKSKHVQTCPDSFYGNPNTSSILIGRSW